MRVKKLLLSLIFGLPFTFAFGQATQQGNVIVDLYYGAPNLGKSFYSGIAESSDVSNYKVTGLGPMGIRAEYMVGDRIGVGVDVILNTNKVSYTSQDTVYDGNSGTTTYETNTYERNMRRLRVQARFNYHFDISNPDLDAYFGVGAGTNNRFRDFYKNGQKLDDTYEGSGNLTLIPFSLRVCTGIRYYFTENIGISGEIGLGGPLVSAGLSVKF